jgi:hypothetical protein
MNGLAGQLVRTRAQRAFGSWIEFQSFDMKIDLTKARGD